MTSAEFARSFYDKLFESKSGEELKRKFKSIETQHADFAKLLRDIENYDPKGHSHLKDNLRNHAGRGITIADVGAFRRAFIEQVGATFPEAPRKRDAWNVVLHGPFRDLCAFLR